MKKLRFLALALLALPLFSTAWALSLPQANLVISPSTGQISRPFTFDASDSRNAQGTAGKLEYRFQFRNGEDWTQWSTKSVQTYTPMDIGTLRVRLQVRDKDTQAVQTTYRTYRVLGDLSGYARIEVSTRTPKAGEPIRFELIVSLPRTDDKDDVQVRWDFDSDGVYETGFSRTKIAWHTYDLTEVRQLSPTAEVKFPGGVTQVIRRIQYVSARGTSRGTQTDYSSIQVLPSDIVPPILDISPGGTGNTEAMQFRFDASKSLLPSNGWIEWSIDGSDYIRGYKVITHQFTSPGEHIVRVRSCKGYSNPECAETSATIEVKEDAKGFLTEISLSGYQQSLTTIAPHESYAASVGDQIRFSASVRSQGNALGKISYAWDFEGDGTVDTTFSTLSTAEHSFSRAGTYRPTLHAMSADGIEKTAFVTLTIGDNTCPQIHLSVSPTKVWVGESMRVRADVADNESKGTQLQTRFDMEGDGTWDTSFRTTQSLYWRYYAAGKYDILAQVRDGGGCVNQAELPFQVFRTGNPKAYLSVTPSTGVKGTLFTFDGSKSEGEDLQYWWDTNYKGSRDYFRRGSATLEHTFHIAGTYTVALRTVNSVGEDLATVTVVVTDEEGSGGGSIFDNEEGKTWEDVPLVVRSFDGALGLPNSSVIGIPRSYFPPNVEQSTSSLSLFDSDGRPLSPAELREQSAQSGTFSPETKEDQAPVLTRAQALQMLYRDKRVPPAFPGSMPFSDVETSDWYAGIALQAYRDGLVRGTYFYPESEVSADEAARLMKQFYGTEKSFTAPVTLQKFQSAIAR